MSENTKSETVFCDGLWLKKRTFPDGGTSIKVSVLASKFGAWVKQHKKADGFVNIEIKEKRDDPSKMYAVLDTWAPDAAKTTPAPKAASTAPKPTVKKAAPVPAEPVQDDDVF